MLRGPGPVLNWITFLRNGEGAKKQWKVQGQQ